MMEDRGRFKRRKQKKIFLLTAFFTFFTLTTFAQVTIGSDIPPEKGALLDIKTLKFEDQTKFVSSGDGGILLPRVEIYDVNVLDVFNDITGLDDNEQKSKHTGLVVYNVGTTIGTEPNTKILVEEGIYVWDGSKWRKAGINNPHNFFYMPSIEIDLSMAGSIDLYDRYEKQFSQPAISSHPAIAPTIPYYKKEELYYYVTEYSPDLFENITLSQEGVLNYTPKIDLPDDVCCAYINIVFVVK